MGGVEISVWLIACSIPLLVSCYYFNKQQDKWSLFWLLGAALGLRLVMTSIDPFLYDWDEKFHALVAKHMMLHPFFPRLHAFPAKPHNYIDWSSNYLWIHKQPLFMWQMALSMKLFGVNVFALRLPSAIMGTVMVLFTWRIANIWTGNRWIGFISAALMAVSNYQLEEIAGAYGLDHNDMALQFYFWASVWAWCEYWLAEKGSKLQYFWLLLIGIFSGCAVLNKWLVGLLVFSGWGVTVLADKKERFAIRNYIHMAVALAVTVAVFLPWQIYIISHFPLESAYEYKFNREHIFTVLDGHDGTVLFYLYHLPQQYGVVLIPVLLLGFGALRSFMGERRIFTVAFVAMFVVIYFFFSVVVRTKMISFTFTVAPIASMLIAIGIISAADFLRKKNVVPDKIFGLLIFIVVLDCFSPWQTLEKRTRTDHVRDTQIAKTKMYKSLAAQLPKGCILFNCNNYDEIQLEFWQDIGSYNKYPTLDVLHQVQAKGYKVAVFRECDGIPLPDYLASDTSVIKIDAPIIK